jgi:hypothetical protein
MEDVHFVQSAAPSAKRKKKTRNSFLNRVFTLFAEGVNNWPKATVSG